ncbi:T9SS type B sorting domain-containing protein [Flavivirga aquimarina]|uniref:T9SS type B sorting domain-containing protein n=1 Tax=Flavivirga aquimarina TaxID=2027862 RepID=A0ABT8W8C2_9FLAO|nr:T9SS type B sorting domain-containing protein [Flavivirga aquimarina]MDO5969363.1 T9SS type B sorting domain-containing protein [Flavivirga aquimarina]
MLIINANDSQAGEFYRTTISGLCENTSYEFSSWMVNLLPFNHQGCGANGNGIPINVTFEIWDNTDTNLLASGSTGSIPSSTSPNWQQYALVFQTSPSETSVILKMRNNGTGGCGNDLAIDDIVFKSCGDTVTITDSLNDTEFFICDGNPPYSTVLTATPDFAIFTTHFYQWQESPDGINWTDISGETNQTYTTPLLSNTIFYRAKIAEDAVNLSNPFCNTLSDTFEFGVIPIPDAPVSNGNLNICENDTTPLTVTVPNGIIVNWYDALVGGNLLQANSYSFSPGGVSGTYYAEAETTIAGCLSVSRTPLQVDYLEVPEVVDESFSFCENTDTTLHANVANSNIVTSYLWNTGEVSESINVTSPGTYTVEVANGACSITKTITLSQIDNPIIEMVETDGNDIVITTSNTGDFMYSLDGNIFQSSHTFFNIDGGLYTIYAKERHCDELITTLHLHFYIPKFFTPNNDGNNDLFDLKGIEFFSTSYVSIFNRYGKLIKNSRNSAFSWNGTFNSQPLPTGDYWYVIIVDNQKLTGHFTLKR